MAFEVDLETFKQMHASCALSDNGYWFMRKETVTDDDGQQHTVVMLYLYRQDAHGQLIFTKVPVHEIPLLYFSNAYEVEDSVGAVEMAFQMFARDYMRGLWRAKRYLGLG